MITIKIDDIAVKSMLKALPGDMQRAAEISIDKTAQKVKAAIKEQIPKVFDRPNPWTKNSLQMTPTHNHNMTASVWFKEPERMSEHYLVPQVEGTVQRMKGFERALGMKMVPSKLQPRDQYGNISAGKVRQVLSVLGKAETSAGFSANLTERSKLTNKKDRDYVFIKKGNRNRLPPGIYERTHTAGKVVAAYYTLDRKRHKKDYRAMQLGTRKPVVRARGLRPVFLLSKTPNARVSPRLPFYEIGKKVVDKEFPILFSKEIAKFMNHV